MTIDDNALTKDHDSEPAPAVLDIPAVERKAVGAAEEVNAAGATAAGKEAFVKREADGGKEADAAKQGVKSVVEDVRDSVSQEFVPRKHEKWSLRGRAFLTLWRKFAIKGKVQAEGLENLEKLSENDRCIIAGGHISDGDMPAAITVLDQHLDLAFANPSTSYYFDAKYFQKKPSDFGVYLGNRLIGRRHFHPYTTVPDESVPTSKRRGLFKPDDYLPMKKAMEEDGKALMIAAHTPSWGALPDKGGIGCIYLAQITDNAVILPVVTVTEGHVMTEGAVIQSMLNKPTAKAVVGEPIRFKKIDGIERYADLHERKGSLTPDEEADFARMKGELREQSDYLMKKLAELLPEDRRGRWGEKAEEVEE